MHIYFEALTDQKGSDTSPMNAGLVEHVERTVKSESSRAPDRPVYLVGESVGACIALAVAARNRDVDLVLVLVNPGLASITLTPRLFLPRSVLSCGDSNLLLTSLRFGIHFAGTSFHRSQLQSLSALLDLVPDPFHSSTPRLLNFLTGLAPPP